MSKLKDFMIEVDEANLSNMKLVTFKEVEEGHLCYYKNVREYVGGDHYPFIQCEKATDREAVDQSCGQVLEVAPNTPVLIKNKI